MSTFIKFVVYLSIALLFGKTWPTGFWGWTAFFMLYGVVSSWRFGSSVSEPQNQLNTNSKT